MAQTKIEPTREELLAAIAEYFFPDSEAEMTGIDVSYVDSDGVSQSLTTFSVVISGEMKRPTSITPAFEALSKNAENEH